MSCMLDVVREDFEDLTEGGVLTFFIVFMGDVYRAQKRRPSVLVFVLLLGCYLMGDAKLLALNRDS